MVQWPLIDPLRSSIVVDQYSWWLHTMIFDAWPKTKLDRVPWLTIGQIFFRGWKPVWTAVHLFEVGGTTETTKHLVLQHPSWSLRPHFGGLGFSAWSWRSLSSLLRFDGRRCRFWFSLLGAWGGASISTGMVPYTGWWLQLLPLHGLHPALNHAFYASSERSCRHSTEPYTRCQERVSGFSSHGLFLFAFFSLIAFTVPIWFVAFPISILQFLA